ncbi:hypothetical protein CASFOL_038905 [Castilleja foliolosa]|uniref:Uncharacterized protein n=1 Tax=Castilleja foliolosa TaxID=1961234 RepID=A0ABD3BI90_9LAMI
MDRSNLQHVKRFHFFGSSPVPTLYEVKNIHPHAPPFLFGDKILKLRPDSAFIGTCK